MTNKAYIVANEQQEREVLEKLEREGLVWFDGRENPTEWIPSQKGTKGAEFPYVLLDDGEISWKFLNDLSDEEIAFDGRKESKMNDKYIVSQEFMDALNEWQRESWTCGLSYYMSADRINNLPSVIKTWWEHEIGTRAINNRLIAIIRWVNGEDVFEIEKPKKWIVMSKGSSKAGRNLYVKLDISHGVKTTMTFWGKDNATKFDTKEEAESWANAHQEVIEVEE